jgi:hypothetical protein
MNGKGFGKNPGLMEVYPGICLVELRKATKTLRQNSWCLRYRCGALPNWSKWNEVITMLRSIKLIFK